MTACLREKKTLLPDILIFQRFLKFSIAKGFNHFSRMCNSRALPLTVPYCEACSLAGLERARGGLPFESDGNVRRLFRGRKYTLWVFNIFNHTNHRGIVIRLCVKKNLNLIKHKPHPDCQPAFGFNSNFPTSILVSFS